MERSKFQALVAQALDSLPVAFREKLTNVAVIVEDLPPEQAESQGLLLGLFHGIPRTEKSVFYSSPPDRIFLYQRNIEAICAARRTCAGRSARRCSTKWGTTLGSVKRSCAGCEDRAHTA